MAINWNRQKKSKRQMVTETKEQAPHQKAATPKEGLETDDYASPTGRPIDEDATNTQHSTHEIPIGIQGDA